MDGFDLDAWKAGEGAAVNAALDEAHRQYRKVLAGGGNAHVSGRALKASQAITKAAAEFDAALARAIKAHEERENSRGEILD